MKHKSHQSHECTLYLVQRQWEVLLCRYVLQNDGQFSFILHCGVYAALHLHKHNFCSFWTCVLVCACIMSKKKKMLLILGPTLGCRAYHSSIWESNSQESKVSSTSPRKLLCPNRSWCHTDTCSVRVSSCEWLITYYTPQDEHELNQNSFKPFKFVFIKFFSGTDPQALIENRINGVGLDARLPLALSWRIWQQVRLHIAAMTKTQWLSQAQLEGMKTICPCLYQHKIPEAPDLLLWILIWSDTHTMKHTGQ